MQFLIGVISLIALLLGLSVVGYIAFFLFELIVSKFLYLIIGAVVIGWLISK